ncbi:MAG: 4-hydroxy-3-methylbut-2-enyl diphosphate reductase [Planctomycetota bacterium]|jgi:4-hydroxy-3-methylbut-2-enyl diphosphate reductase
MRIVRATAMGTCFGVRDALAAAAAIDDPADVTIHGELVHNPVVLAALAARGFRFTAEGERDALPSTRQVVITAHGISERERLRLLRAGKQLIDTTCPLVARVHEAAQRLARAGRLVLVVGRRGHVEVRGIVEDLDDYEVIERPEDVRRYDHDRLGIVCQTTTATSQVETIHAAVIRRNPQAHVELVDSVCRPTRERQAALEALIPEVDGVVVVGGRNSNNTRRLVERCRVAGVPALHVTGPEDVLPEWFVGYAVVGLTAGTSTPDSVIDAVERALESIA